MKHLLAALAILCGGLWVNAKTAAPCDTITIDSSKIESVIQHDTTTAKGYKVTKYFFKYDNELISSSQRVVEAYQLSKQYNAKCALALVINTRTGRKRIILH